MEADWFDVQVFNTVVHAGVVRSSADFFTIHFFAIRPQGLALCSQPYGLEKQEWRARKHR